MAFQYEANRIRRRLTPVRAFLFLGGLYLALNGCAFSSSAHLIDDYETQKRIVWQGILTVSVGEDTFRMIYFGYDRNGDLTRLTGSTRCRGVDLLEYKGLSANGQWMYEPIIVFLDDDYDCYADRVLYDCDGDGVFEKAVDVSARAVQLEVVSKDHRNFIDGNCLQVRKPYD